MTYKLPGSWEKVKLGTVIKLYDYKRVPLSARERAKHEKIYPYYGANGIIDYVDNYIFDGSYILLAEDGTVLEGNNNPVVHRVKDKFWANNHAHVFQSVDSVCNQEFLYYALKNVNVLPYITGAVQLKINQTNLKRIQIPLPPLKEQKAIAQILLLLDNKIKNNKKIAKNLEAQAQAIFKHWFVDFEFPNEEGEPYKSSGGEMVKSELGPIPNGWRVRKLGDIIKICNGKRPKNKKEVFDDKNRYPILGASGVMGYTTDYIYDDKILVMGRVGTHGIIQQVNGKVWASDNTMVVKTNYYEYVNQILLGLDYKSLNRGSTQPLLSQKDIKDQSIIIEDNLLFVYENITMFWRNKIDNLKKQNQKLEGLRDTLLPKLMSGELRIPLD